jgi:hypothetical protein
MGSERTASDKCSWCVIGMPVVGGRHEYVNLDRSIGSVACPNYDPTPSPAPTEPRYPCDRCGTMRTKAEGGTIFTVCDECWDKDKSRTPPAPAPAEPPAPAALPERWAEFAAYRKADNALRRAEREVNRTEGDPDAYRKADAAVRAFTEAENAMVTAYHRLAQRVAELTQQVAALRHERAVTLLRTGENV